MNLKENLFKELDFIRQSVLDLSNEIKDWLVGLVLGNSDKKRRQIDRSTRHNVWQKYIGFKTEDKCFCCNIRSIYFDDFEVGHIIPVSKGGSDNIDNLRPICRPCNLGMGNIPMDHYIKEYYPQSEKNDIKIRRSNNIMDEDKKQLILNELEEVIKEFNSFIYEYESNDPSVIYWKQFEVGYQAIFESNHRECARLKKEYDSKKLIEYNNLILPCVLEVLFKCSIILGESDKEVQNRFDTFEISSDDILSLKERVKILIKLKSIISFR